MLLSLGFMFCSNFFVVKKEPSVHVLAESLVRVAIIAVQVLGRHVHAGRHPPAQGSDGLQHREVIDKSTGITDSICPEIW